MTVLELKGAGLTLEQVAEVALGHRGVRLAAGARGRLLASRAVVERALAQEGPAYGVNTGLGRLSEVRIAPARIRELQVNLVRSHACGVGPALPQEVVRAMLLLRANSLAKGYSGVRAEVVEGLCALLNRRVHPVVPAQGSVGASGDLAPLAHLALVLIGEGEAEVGGERLAGGAALRAAGLKPLVLEAKEGLSLLNGTQAMLACGCLSLLQAERLVESAEVVGALALEALRGTPVAFDARLQAVRGQRGQQASAARLRTLMQGSAIRRSHRHCGRVQDAYCLRCMPQVHGAVRDVLDHVAGVLHVESGSATDNPLVFPQPSSETSDRGAVLSGGNFHGAPLAYAFDYAAIALADLAGIAERRIDRLLNPDINEQLPAFLSSDAGLSSGFMMAQIVAAALISECQVLAHPSSAGNIPTSGGKEDHVSMGMTGALKLRQIVENVERIVGIELMCAAQGVEFRLPLRPSREIGRACAAVRAVVPRLEQDRTLTPDIDAMAAAVRTGAFSAWCQE